MAEDTQGYVTATEAAKLLRVTTRKMAALLADGTLAYQQSEADKRTKWIARADVDKLARQLHALRPVQPKSEAAQATATSAA